MIEAPKQATPHKQLIDELMDSRIPKTEREHAAAREIERLRQAIAEAEKQKPMAPRCMGTNCRMPDADNHSPECIWETAKSQGWSDAPEAIEARQAIAEAEKHEVSQEPVAWMNAITKEIYWRNQINSDVPNVPLYTHPQPKRKWVGLTDEEFDALVPYCHNEFDLSEFKDFARAIEAKLKEKNT